MPNAEQCDRDIGNPGLAGVDGAVAVAVGEHVAPGTQAAPEPLPGSRSPKSWFVRPVIGTVSGPNSSGVVDVYPAGWISRTRYEPGAMPVKA